MFWTPDKTYPKTVRKNKKRHPANQNVFLLGYKDSNLEMTESESVALPFGDSPSLQRCLLYIKEPIPSSTFFDF